MPVIQRRTLYGRLVLISDETRHKWSHRVDVVISAMQDHSLNLNDWEKEFMSSVSLKLDDNKDLSIKEGMKLEEIWNKVG